MKQAPPPTQSEELIAATKFALDEFFTQKASCATHTHQAEEALAEALRVFRNSVPNWERLIMKWLEDPRRFFELCCFYEEFNKR
jgi:hypothetical protein